MTQSKYHLDIVIHRDRSKKTRHLLLCDEIDQSYVERCLYQG
jgi:hypothetical protein